MATKQRFRGKYRLELREKDHLPMHVHLTGAGLNVRISLESLSVVEGEWPAALSAEVMAWLAAHRDELIEEWKKWHP